MKCSLIWGLAALIVLHGSIVHAEATSDTAQNQALLSQPAIAVAYNRKYGTDKDDELASMATDSQGNVYLAGNTENEEYSMGRLGFLRKYDAQGDLLWHKNKPGISIDSTTTDKDNNAYVVGVYTVGNWPSQKDYLYLEKYNASGGVVWTKKFTVPVAQDRTRLFANAVVTDTRGSNTIVILFEEAYYPYQVRQLVARKYAVSGRLLWESHVGTSSAYSAAGPKLTVDLRGNLYITFRAGYGQRQPTIGRLSARGVYKWSVPLTMVVGEYWEGWRNAYTEIHDIVTDKTGRIYVTGITQGNLEGLNAGSNDSFLRKYNINGNVLWTKQFGTMESDFANGLVVDELNRVYVAGSTRGSLRGNNRGDYDPYVRKYRANGDLLQTHQFGSEKFDIANTVKVDTDGLLLVGGNSYGALGGRVKGGSDVYFRKYNSFRPR